MKRDSERFLYICRSEVVRLIDLVYREVLLLDNVRAELVSLLENEDSELKIDEQIEILLDVRRRSSYKDFLFFASEKSLFCFRSNIKCMYNKIGLEYEVSDTDSDQ